MRDLIIDCLIACGEVASNYKAKEMKQAVAEEEKPISGNNFGSNPCFDILNVENIPDASRNFITGLKNFYDQQGYLSPSQLGALERTTKSLIDSLR